MAFNVYAKLGGAQRIKKNLGYLAEISDACSNLGGSDTCKGRMPFAKSMAVKMNRLFFTLYS